VSSKPMSKLGEKIRNIRTALENLTGGAVMMREAEISGGKPRGGWDWETVLSAVDQLEEATRAARKLIRARATKERRASCTHKRIREYHDGTSNCRDCPATFGTPHGVDRG